MSASRLLTMRIPEDEYLDALQRAEAAGMKITMYARYSMRRPEHAVVARREEILAELKNLDSLDDDFLVGDK